MNKKYKLERGKADLNSSAGNYLTGAILASAGPDEQLKDFQKRRNDAISDHDILLTLTGLLCNSYTDFNDVDLFRGDQLFRDAYGLEKLPSEATLRTRLDELPARCHDNLREMNLGLLKSRSFSCVSVEGMGLIPVDIDVSPFDNSGSHKQGVSMTYKKHTGYAPIFGYIGSEGYMLDCELRPGSQHCQKDTPGFIARCVKHIRELGLDGKCLIRLDSGNDAAENFAALGDEYFIIKRNLRKEPKEQWLSMARRVGTKVESREGKNVYIGEVSHMHPGNDESRPLTTAVFEVTERLTDPDGNFYLIPKIQVDTWWTNLSCAAQTVINLYHDHGTSEQYHSELKSDLDIERLPSGKFCVNAIVLLCGMLAFNALRTLGQEVISRADKAPVKIKVKRWRLKTVLQNVVYCAARVVKHAGQFKLSFGKRCPWFDILKDIAASYA
jgi:hypothetical protein